MNECIQSFSNYANYKWIVIFTVVYYMWRKMLPVNWYSFGSLLYYRRDSLLERGQWRGKHTTLHLNTPLLHTLGDREAVKGLQHVVMERSVSCLR